MKLIVPREQCYNTKSKKNNVDKISYEIEYALCRLIDKDITFLKEWDNLIEELWTKLVDFSIESAFNEIDILNLGYIHFDALL